MSIRTRTIISLLSTFSAAAIAALSLVRLTVPAFAGWYGGLSPAILDRFVDDFTASLIGLLVGAIGAGASLTRFAGRSGAAGVLAVAAAVGAILLAPGNIIPVAGYTFAMVALGIVVAGAVLLTIRHVIAGGVVLALFAATMVFFTVLVGERSMLPQYFSDLVAESPRIVVTAVYLALAVGVVLSAIGDGRRRRGAVARWVLAHRVAITVVAAVCAVPYVFVRVSWLTPWPLFSPGAELLAEHPEVLVTGLSLGFAMLVGGVLTLGLVRPWGERFPRWFAGVGGRSVPVGLPVIAATTVAVLFTAGGVGMVLQALAGDFGALGSGAVVEIVGMFPFWLWGPALALAAWGYAMHRADGREVAGAEPDAAPAASGLAQLDAWESLEA